jgi:hypothetical protein
MIAAVYEKGATSPCVDLPAATWYDWRTVSNTTTWLPRLLAVWPANQHMPTRAFARAWDMAPN